MCSMLHLVNATAVVTPPLAKTVFPWTILKVSDEESTIEGFFSSNIRPRLSFMFCEIESALVGPEKGLLDGVDINLPIVGVINSFGHFLKYVVKCSNPTSTATETTASGLESGSEPDMMMLSTIVPPTVERNKKDKMFNDILYFLSSSPVTLRRSEKDLGKRLILLLQNLFWHIDGHLHVFQQQAQAIPQIFIKFTNYNVPERSKHRKRLTSNLSSDVLQELSLELSTILSYSFWDKEDWLILKPHFNALLISISSYSDYLIQKNKRMKEHHRSPTPAREIAENLHLKHLSAIDQSLPSVLEPINQSVRNRPLYDPLFITDMLPSDHVQRHRAINCLVSTGLSSTTMLLTYTPGGNICNLHFIWRVPAELSVSECTMQSQVCIEQTKKKVPVFHSRAMRSALFKKFGRISPSTKPSTLRFFYKELTGDQSASTNLSESDIDSRIRAIIEMEDPDIVHDLRILNGKHDSKYNVFWEESQKFLNEDLAAVDERRHCSITHLSRAISMRDFVEQVSQRCPEGIPIPSVEWVRLQFWPKNPSLQRSLQYTGRFKMKFMIQQRQFRKDHIDAHYAAACYRYLREYAVTVREFCLFFSLDDKHKIKVGEPEYPVAAAERGRRVPVRHDEFLTVADHDFTKFALIPSAIFNITVPENISDSWYSGSVYVGLKDSVFEPSAPFRHACELYNVIRLNSLSKPILFLYCDGGPDHRLTYVSVQLSIICLFLKLDLDYICVARTAPYNSWKNPVERVMSILNLGLQCVGLARKKMGDEFEQEAAKCNNLSDLRTHLKGQKLLVQDSLSPVKILLCQIFSRLKLHDEYIHTFNSATTSELSEFWSAIITLDSTLSEDGIYRKETIGQHEKVVEFMSHCCQISHYTFDILKCGVASCSICSPICLPLNVFNQLRHLPLPVPDQDNDGHYLPFQDVFGSQTSEEHRPSYKKSAVAKQGRRKRKLPYYASVQHVRNSQLMVQCSECSLWRLIFSKYKLTKEQREVLQQLIEDFEYTCGATLKDLHLPEEFDDVDVRDHDCFDTIERLYYSAKYAPICVYCGIEQSYSDERSYPQCILCKDKPPIVKK